MASKVVAAHEHHLKDRINFLRLLLIIGLVFLHYGEFPNSYLSPFKGFASSPTPIATFVNSFLLFFFFSAVPLLSAISGYLFFKQAALTLAFYGGRVRSRIRSILLPMISWNVIILTVFLMIRFASPQSAWLGIIAYDLDHLDVGSLINALVGVTRHPVNFQFWFLHDLFLTVLCTPILFVLLRRATILGLFILGLGWLAGFDFGVFFRADVVFFFYLGGAFRVNNWNLDFMRARTGLMVLAVYAGLIAVRTLAPALIPDEGSAAYGYDVITRALRVVGVMGFWASAPALMVTALGEKLTQYGMLAFFLHSSHWPLNQFIKAGVASLLPGDGEVARLLNYGITVALTLVVAFGVARVLSTLFPNLFSHLSGGRSFGKPDAIAGSTLPRRSNS